MTQNPPSIHDSDVDEPVSTAPSDTVPRRSFREVLHDRRFWMTAPALLIALGSTGYFLIAGAKGTQPPLINQVNTSIPNALTDSVPKSKLELQAAEQRKSGTRQDASSGLQTGLPGSADLEKQSGSPAAGMPTTLDPYLYRQRQQAEPINPALLKPYYPDGPVRHYSVEPSVRRKDHRPSTNGYGGSGMPVEPDDALLRQNPVQRQVDDRQRLLTLLTEYKRDKEAKAALTREGERPRKVESGVVVSTLGEADNRRLNGFYGLYSTGSKEQQEKTLSDELGTIRAVIHQDQQITDGGRVQLRLLEPVLVQGVQIPANTLVYGIGNFGTERVGISLNSIQYEGRIFPIKLTVHDMDGMLGVFVPNVLAAQEGKQVLGQTLSGANYNLNGSSVGGTRAAAMMAGISAAQAGLSGARSVLQRKITQQKAVLKGNYYVLLK